MSLPFYNFEAMYNRVCATDYRVMDKKKGTLEANLAVVMTEEENI